jgi:hypothetical protein
MFEPNSSLWRSVFGMIDKKYCLSYLEFRTALPVSSSKPTQKRKSTDKPKKNADRHQRKLPSLSPMAKKLQPPDKFKFMTERSISKSTKSSKKSCKTSEFAIPMRRSTSPQVKIVAVTVIATMMSHITILKTENFAFCIKISIGIGRNNS